MRSRLRAFLLPLLVLAVLVDAPTAVAAQAATSKPQAPTTPAVKPPVGDTSRTSLDWPGAYTGVLPCADCEGIETTITLSVDLTYTLRTRDVGKQASAQERKGRFTWDDAGATITLLDAGAGPSTYQVGERQLTQLDMGGKRITGALAPRYVLQQAPPTPAAPPAALVAAARWRLVELSGKPVAKAADENRQPHLAFTREGHRVTGFAGCNRITGGFEFRPPNMLYFTGVAATRMMCPDMSVEDALMKALRSTDTITLTADSLVLNRGKAEPLARFEAK
jgi:copper homeostasis protein (lipoprotein)